MSLNETALACLNRNRLLYLNMLEVLRRGSAELLWAGSLCVGGGSAGADLRRSRRAGRPLPWLLARGISTTL